jgi:trigger factor
MQRELATAIKAKVKQQVMDAIVSANESQEVPRALIDQEIGNMRKQMFQQFGGAGAENMDLESLLPADMFQDQAERRVKLGLLLNEYISKVELKADADKVREAIEEIASTYQDPDEVVQWYYSNQEQLSGVESMVLEDQAVQQLLAQATITDQACTYQEAIAKAQENQSV